MAIIGDEHAMLNVRRDDAVAPMDIINGTAGNDTLTDTKVNDTINALGGSDKITVSRGGTDQVNGGEGSDTLVVDYRAARSAVYDSGAPGANGTIGGFNGRYYVNSSLSVSYDSIEKFDITTGNGDYDDTVTTATGNDKIKTNDGNDLVNVGAGKDTADGGDGTDRLSADFSDDAKGVTIDLREAVNKGKFGNFSNFEYFGTIIGSDSDDIFISATGRGTQTFNLDDGDDSATVVNGTSTVNGGSDSDTLVVDFSAATSAV